MTIGNTFTTRLIPTLIGVGVLGVAAVLASGASALSSDAGYAGVGANFLPLLLAGLLGISGVWLIFEAVTGGFRNLAPGSLDVAPSWAAFFYLSAGLLLNATVISHLGFIMSCALCYVLAVRGLRCGQGLAGGTVQRSLRDFGIGLAIAAPVFWLFTKGLNVSLPGFALFGVEASGWL